MVAAVSAVSGGRHRRVQPLGEASTLQQIRGASDVTLLSDALILPAAVLACLVVNQITQRVSGDVRSNGQQPTSVSPTSDRMREAHQFPGSRATAVGIPAWPLDGLGLSSSPRGL